MKAIVLVLSLVLACAGSIAANPANKALAKKHADQTKQAATQHSTQAAGQQATQAQATGQQATQAQAAGQQTKQAYGASKQTKQAQAAGQQATQAQAAGKQTKQAQAAGTTKTVSAKQGKAAH